MEPIAIIGMSCRFPGANQTEALWKLLRDKENAITEVPPDRWDVNYYYTEPPATRGKMCTRWGGFIERVDQFDAAFFGISPREACFMDPQQRLVLEVAWEALEHAGVAATNLAGSNTGVFVGVSNYDYNRLLCRDPATMDAYSSTGTILAITANRLSYLLNLRGPSIAVDTACSSSLVSMHLACQSLRSGESNLAIAGGVNLILSPEVTIILSQGGLMSPDGRCKAFDEGANGYVRSEGCGILILKRLSDAQRDGNNSLALIRGSAVNQDGCTNGLTAPSATAQQAVIRQALANAEAQPNQLSYVEAHGSGTRLGDIIETRALRSVLLEDRSAERPCAIGSIKTNIGHAESAAGVAGLIKVILSLQHNTIPANLHLNKLNPYIRFENTPLFVPTEARPWHTNGVRRLAGVSSFGIGGTNAHLIIEEAPEQAPTVHAPEGSLQLLPLSAKTAHDLGAMIRNYKSFLAEQNIEPLADLCFTASCGRSHFPHRVAFRAKSIEHLREQLSAVSDQAASEESYSRQVTNWQTPVVAFLFTGQGAEQLGFGHKLYETELAFREIIDRCDEFLGKRFDRTLASLLYPNAASSQAKIEAVHASLFAFGFQCALAELWRSWGIKPMGVLGFGFGEFVAACVAGVFTLEDGLKIVEEFSGLTDSLIHPAARASTPAEGAHAYGAIESQSASPAGAAYIPEEPLPSRETEGVRLLLHRSEADGNGVRVFSSPRTSPFSVNDSRLTSLYKTAAEISYSVPQTNLISSVTSETVDVKAISSTEHWRNLLHEEMQPVKAFESLRGLGISILLEMGLRTDVGELGAECLFENSGVLLNSLSEKKDDWEQTLESLGDIYERGVEVNWAAFYGKGAHRLVPLPTYIFERKRFWFDNAES